MKHVCIVVVVIHVHHRTVERIEVFNNEYAAESFADTYREDVHSRYSVDVRIKSLETR